MRIIAILLLLFNIQGIKAQDSLESSIKLLILGTAQDGGYPQMACKKPCCEDISFEQYVSSLAIVDGKDSLVWLIDCTPDIKYQFDMISGMIDYNPFTLEGIFLTHAHIGHYSGLTQFGREVMGMKGLKVYAMPRMSTFLRDNGPWSQLVSLRNIDIVSIKSEEEIGLENGLSIKAVEVPHRDEFSETVGYEISGPNKKVLYIPDIDKWESWNKNIVEEVQKFDLLFIDGTFFSIDELPGRDMSEIPHPFVLQTEKLMQELDSANKAKVHFIHMNHTNPLLRKSEARDWLKEKGFNVARQGTVVDL